ncbi:MAG: cytidine deaminase [Pirellulales bacterium]|nr:cytidine deaminase [Pirellulales bacterium]
MDDNRRDQLIAMARSASQQAYAPYSKFQVGAALLAKSGSLYAGTNVENASYGLTNCAERTAVFRAVTEGDRDFEAMAIASPGGVAPCGACRQVMYEFAPNLVLFLIDANQSDRVTEVSLAALLPDPFTSSDKK